MPQGTPNGGRTLRQQWTQSINTTHRYYNDCSAELACYYPSADAPTALHRLGSNKPEPFDRFTARFKHNPTHEPWQCARSAKSVAERFDDCDGVEQTRSGR